MALTSARLGWIGLDWEGICYIRLLVKFPSDDRRHAFDSIGLDLIFLIPVNSFALLCLLNLLKCFLF